MPTTAKLCDGLLLGEGPHWGPESKSLYFVDILTKSILKYTADTKKVTKTKFDSPPSFIIPIEDKKNHYVTSQGNELATIRWDGDDNTAAIIDKFCPAKLSTNPPTTYNDAKCDSLGRLWIGAHVVAQDFNESGPHGVLYSVDSNKRMQSHVDKIRITNGIAFNDKTQKMFYIDSLTHSVDGFNFDLNAGTINNRQVWFSLRKFGIPGVPDGMTIDVDGNLWVAVFGGYCVLKIDGNQPQKLLEKIQIPAEQVTSCTFGGPDFAELYVTTACMEFGGKVCDPLVDGVLYKVTGLKTRGLPPNNYKI